MASGGSDYLSLKPTLDKTNFTRLTRLLICGGTRAMRGLFDFIIPPRHLATTLNDPSVLRTLQDLKIKRILTQDQWNILYPSPGVVVKSTSFDVTLLFKLLRNICGLAPPATGWEKLPNSTDNTLGADLARIKYYRNTVYAHVNNEMEISDGDFQSYWKEIEAALLRIVRSHSPSSVGDCDKEIKDCLIAPITDADEKNVEELKWWYNQDMDLKSMVCRMDERLRVQLEDIHRGQRENRPGVAEIVVNCVVKLASTGAWIVGSAFIFNRYMDDPETLKALVQEVVLPTGLMVVAILRGSIKIVLRTTQLDALEELWDRYQEGHLRSQFEKVLITEELRQLAKDDAVEIEVFVSDEEYQRARKRLASEDKEGKEKTKLLLESDEDDDFISVEQPPKKLKVRTINGLVTADLTNYQFIPVFPDFTSVNNLQVIRMLSHSLEDIPGEDCKIPNSFCNMKYLKKLGLFGDNFRTAGLTCLPRDFGQLQSLEELNLQHNNFSEFPEQICKLQNLKKLYLNCCGLTSISTNISSLINLLEADFSQNDFSAGLPKQLFDLPRLKDLYLIECKLDHLPPEIGNLEQLEGIRLNDNFLRELPEEFFNLRHLKKLTANNNNISKLSSNIRNLQSLRVLMLKGNNLKFLPEEIGKLPCLQVVNVFDNKLTCLPETITEIESSMQFVVHGNVYLQQPPLSVCTKGIDSIKGYLESMKKDSPVHSNRIKIVMLGEAGAGKTCLTKALVKSRASDRLEDDSTIGVEMHHWKIEPDGLEACIVDLAGHRRYQHTHPFFLSEEALHILVVNLKEYLCNKESFKRNVEDWIEWVTARLLKPRIMIVPTHKDECDEKQVTKKCADILDRIQDHEKREMKRLDSEMKKLQKKKRPLKEMGIDVEPELENLKLMKKHRPIMSAKLFIEQNQRKSENVQEQDLDYIQIVPVSSKEELHGIIPLKEEIKRIAKKRDLFPFIGQDLPPSWVALEEAIKKYKQEIDSLKVPCMTLKDFQTFAWTKAQLSGIQVLSALKYLDAIGEIKFYGEVEASDYSVYLDLPWLCRTVKCLFRHDILEGFGLEYKEDYKEFGMEKIEYDIRVNELTDNEVLSVILLRCIWKELRLDEGDFQKLTKALICFGLACELPMSHQDEEKKLFIPWFLHSELSPSAKEKVFPSTPDSNVTEYKLKYSTFSGYLPPGMFDRLCVYSYTLGIDASVWKNSMLIHLDSDINIFLELQDTYITITGRTGSGSKESVWSGLLEIVENLDSLLKEWPGLVWNTYTVCPHCVKNKKSKPYHFECKWLSGQGPPSLLCKRSKLRKLPIDLDLLVPPKDLLLKRLKPSKPVSGIVSIIL